MKKHAKVFFKGLSRALFGALTTGAYGLAVYGFVSIPAEVGYTAVCDCMGAILTAGLALVCTYYMGSGKVAKKKKTA